MTLGGDRGLIRILKQLSNLVNWQINPIPAQQVFVLFFLCPTVLLIIGFASLALMGFFKRKKCGTKQRPWQTIQLWVFLLLSSTLSLRNTSTTTSTTCSQCMPLPLPLPLPATTFWAIAWWPNAERKRRVQRLFSSIYLFNFSLNHLLPDSQQIPLSCFSLPVPPPPSIGTTQNSLCGIKIKPSKEWQSNLFIYLFTLCLLSLILPFFCPISTESFPSYQILMSHVTHLASGQTAATLRWD